MCVFVLGIWSSFMWEKSFEKFLLNTIRQLFLERVVLSLPLWSVVFKRSLVEQWELYRVSLQWINIHWQCTGTQRFFTLLFPWFSYLYHSSDFPVESLSLVLTEFSCLVIWPIICLSSNFCFMLEKIDIVKRCLVFMSLNNCPILFWQSYTYQYDTSVTYFNATPRQRLAKFHSLQGQVDLGRTLNAHHIWLWYFIFILDMRVLWSFYH